MALSLLLWWYKLSALLALWRHIQENDNFQRLSSHYLISRECHESSLMTTGVRRLCELLYMHFTTQGQYLLHNLILDQLLIYLPLCFSQERLTCLTDWMLYIAQWRASRPEALMLLHVIPKYSMCAAVWLMYSSNYIWTLVWSQVLRPEKNELWRMSHKASWFPRNGKIFMPIEIMTNEAQWKRC